MQVAHGIGANKVILATKTVTPTHPNVTASVSMGYSQIPGVADNANITATASLSNGTTASNSYSIYLDTVTNTSSAVTMAVKHGSTVIISKTVTPVSDAGNVTATVSMSGAQIPSVATNANITATASLSNGATASNSYSIYLESVANTTSTVTMQVAHGSGSNKVILASKSVTPTHPTISISSVTGEPTTSGNYNTDYQYAVGLGSSSVYATGSDIYGKVKVTLSNGAESIVRVRMTVGSSNIARAEAVRVGENDEQFVEVTSGQYIAVVPVSIRAFSTSTATTPFWTGSANVEITDIVQSYFNRVDISTAEAEPSTQSTYNTGVTQRVGFGITQLYGSGSVYYGRVKVTLENDNVEYIRISTPRVNNVVLGEYSASERYSAALSYYKWSSNRGYIKAVAKSSNNVVTEADLDITNLIQEAMSMGSDVSITSVNYYSGPTSGPYGSHRMYVTVYLSNGHSEVRYFDYT